MGEEVAIEALKIGATDYVLKTRLSRILPSVQRALREGQERAERAIAEQALRRSEAYLAEAQRLSHTGSFGWNVQSGEHYWSEETYRIFALRSHHQAEREAVFSTGPSRRRSHGERDRRTRSRRMKRILNTKYRLLMPDGSIKYVHFVAHAIS